MYNVLLRIVDIIEQGTYGGDSLGMKALRLLTPSISNMKLPLCVVVLRQTNEFQSFGGTYQESNAELGIDLRFYTADIRQSEALDIIQVTKYFELATNLFLSRPQLQHNNDNGIVYDGSIRWQLTSDLSNAIPYPFNAPIEAQTFYWGFSARLTVPHTLGITPYPAGA
jgi:hypothetical protein